ncbi:MAG TPA: 1-hydroxy-2-methyl-2-(E)-butenyl 4-diphosphate synthase, partial [Chitinophagaceae bacterium]|nr:1-hydroxy-2-methyl-2-(E)-butenyl 4-diphosphate synthase [Chitinophagaceae bacterium]
EKVRVNPGNYVDKKKFETIDYTDAEYQEEIERIVERFTPLVKICKEYGTAMRIGTNHGSLSDRIMSRYGDTPMGMVESAMEFLRIARAESFHNIVLSMKACNPQVMVQAYRLLIQTMDQEFGECYPLHLGVTEAGDGEDGRIKSAAGIGTLLEDGIGDTVRVSLTEDPEFEIPVCRDLVKRYNTRSEHLSIPAIEQLNYSPFQYKRRQSTAIENIGGTQVPVVVADMSRIDNLEPQDLQSVGYQYDAATDKWSISDAAADYVFTGKALPDFALPGTLKIITWPNHWEAATDKTSCFPIFDAKGFAEAEQIGERINFVMVDCFSDETNVNDFTDLDVLQDAGKLNETVVLCLSSKNAHAMPAIRRMMVELNTRKIGNPVIFVNDSNWRTADEHLIHYATEAGALLLDGFGDGVCFGMTKESYTAATELNASGRNYVQNQTPEAFINTTAFGILQATRTRISKTEYISCPSCGRTLFDLQETTAKIR